MLSDTWNSSTNARSTTCWRRTPPGDRLPRSHLSPPPQPARPRPRPVRIDIRPARVPPTRAMDAAPHGARRRSRCRSPDPVASGGEKVSGLPRTSISRRIDSTCPRSVPGRPWGSNARRCAGARRARQLSCHTRLRANAGPPAPPPTGAESFSIRSVSLCRGRGWHSQASDFGWWHSSTAIVVAISSSARNIRLCPG